MKNEQLSARERLIFPLDVPTPDRAIDLINLLGRHVGMFKVGFELIHSDRARVVSQFLAEWGYREFRDCKLKDTPDTMRGASAALAGRVHAFNMHVDDDIEADDVRLVAEKKGTSKLWCVTLLTSVSLEKCYRLHGGKPPILVALNRARRAVEGGADGLICSPIEAKRFRAEGIEIDLITPGVRPAGSKAGQQARFTTPYDAIMGGSDYLVCGGPIRDAHNPAAMADSIVADIERGLADRAA